MSNMKNYLKHRRKNVKRPHSTMTYQGRLLYLFPRIGPRDATIILYSEGLRSAISKTKPRRRLQSYPISDLELKPNPSSNGSVPKIVCSFSLVDQEHPSRVTVEGTLIYPILASQLPKYKTSLS